MIYVQGTMPPMRKAQWQAGSCSTKEQAPTLTHDYYAPASKRLNPLCKARRCSVLTHAQLTYLSS